MFPYTIYFFTFQVLRNSVLNLESPVIEGPLGQPPFEKPSIHKAINNFMYRFAHLSAEEWKTMHELAQLFLHCLNTWDFPAPSSQKHLTTPDETAVYRVAYTR